MKLLRYGPKGGEKPGILVGGGTIRDLSEVIDDISPSHLAVDRLVALGRLDPSQLPIVSGNPRLGVPVNGIGKFIGIGLNYRDHAVDTKGVASAETVIFSKAISCLNGPYDDVMLPRHAQKPDWEVELGVVVGRTARDVTPADAPDHIAGYVLVNDVSDRGFQNASGQWDKGKGCDTFGPVGPWLVTKDEIDDPQNLDLWLDLNGRRMQVGNTRNMIFTVSELIANVSRYITLEPGDVLTTGTPRGVGADQKPEPVFLKAGDVMRLGVDKLGFQEQRVVAWRAASKSTSS